MQNVLIYGGVGIAAYALVLRPLLSEIGIDPANVAAVNAQDQLPPKSNPFNAASSGGDNTNVWLQVKSDGDSGNFVGIGDGALVVYNAAENIYSAFHDLANQWFGSDFQKVLAAFNSLSNQMQVSQIDQYLQENYQLSLWPLLRDGYPFLPLTHLLNNGLNANDLAQILSVVNNLPQS